MSAAAFVAVVMLASTSWAQNVIDNTEEVVENRAGWVYQAAQLLFLLGVITIVVLVIAYVRFAPSFARDEESIKVVRADRVKVGEELPRRNVDVSQAAPMVVAPPAVPVPVGASVSSTVPAAASAPPASAPAEAPAPASQAPPAAAPPAAPAPRVEVTMDQEVFDATLAELLEAGTDRRIAEGKARRAGMIAAKKKAAGEG